MIPSDVNLGYRLFARSRVRHRQMQTPAHGSEQIELEARNKRSSGTIDFALIIIAKAIPNLRHLRRSEC